MGLTLLFLTFTTIKNKSKCLRHLVLRWFQAIAAPLLPALALVQPLQGSPGAGGAEGAASPGGPGGGTPRRARSALGAGRVGLPPAGQGQGKADHVRETLK